MAIVDISKHLSTITLSLLQSGIVLMRFYFHIEVIGSMIFIMSESVIEHMSRVVRKPAFCICENKDADQLRGKREADQRLCFRYTDSTIPPLPKYEISSF